MRTALYYGCLFKIHPAVLGDPAHESNTRQVRHTPIRQRHFGKQKRNSLSNNALTGTLRDDGNRLVQIFHLLALPLPYKTMEPQRACRGTEDCTITITD